MQTIRLTGLDAQDPLAFLAALGSLLAATEQCRAAKRAAPTMSFTTGATFEPAIHGSFEGSEDLLDSLDRDRAAFADPSHPDPFLSFSYKDAKGNEVYDLKPLPEEFQKFAQAQIDTSTADNRRTLDWAAATLTDVAKDNNGNSKPFALHFTAGNQRFLTIARELLYGAGKTKAQRAVDREDLADAVFGPWPNNRHLKVFNWSPVQDRPYALRAIDPAKDPKRGNPGADWLALRGVAMMSSAPVGTKIVTSGVHGQWKSADFSYPVWTHPLDVDAITMLLRHPGVRRKIDGHSSTTSRTLPSGVRVLTCRISRTDQGGYGSFSRPSHS
ncbi:MAG: type I-G CRISPR-associated protein, Cas3-extension family [Nannocystaceae bacterium]